MKMRFPSTSIFRLFALFLPAFVLFAGPSSAADRVLYLGDSLSMGAFGKTIDQNMREAGLEVYTVVAGGASPYYWLKAYQPLPCTIGFWEKTPSSDRRLGYVRAVPKLEDLIAEHEPNVVIVQTGINLYATLRSRRRPKSDNINEVRSLIDQMCKSIAESGAKGYWVLPPHSHEKRYSASLQNELATIMRETVKEYNGAVFESQKCTKFTDPYPATDGIHYGPIEARQWASRVVSDFNVYMKINSSYASKVPLRATPIKVSPQSTAAFLAVEKSKINEQVEPVVNAKLDPNQPVELKLRLVAKSTIQNLNEAPYRHALGVFEYEVVKDLRGNYPLKKIRVAHGVVFNRRFTSAARRKIGDEIALELVPLSKYPNLNTWHTVDSLRANFDLPLYTPRLN
ncbi:MAG: hypothetical protein HKN23_17045 [Verrucomicrobiales bacterium]|nr:hypothetical protein [Verrucomicrobiales bacterium]